MITRHVRSLTGHVWVSRSRPELVTCSDRVPGKGMIIVCRRYNFSHDALIFAPGSWLPADQAPPGVGG